MHDSPNLQQKHHFWKDIFGVHAYASYILCSLSRLFNALSAFLGRPNAAALVTCASHGVAQVAFRLQVASQGTGVVNVRNADMATCRLSVDVDTSTSTSVQVQVVGQTSD
jgi:hypothetical protein